MELVREPTDKHSLKIRRKLANHNPTISKNLVKAEPRYLKRFPLARQSSSD